VRVGFDATTLVGRISGVGYYTYRVMQSLVEAARAGRVEGVILLSNRPLPPLASDPRVQVYEGLRFPVRSAWMQLLLPLVLRRTRPDVVHFTNYLAPVFPGVPYVVSIHDMSLSLLPQCHTLKKRLLTSSLVPTIARGARRILAPSESTRRDIVRLLGIDPARIRVIPYAASSRFCPAAADLRILEARHGVRAPYFLYVGTLEPRKNLARALRAFSRISPSLPDHSFVLAGQRGWKYEEVLAAAARLDGRVRFLDYLTEEELPGLYAGATALVYPSLYEGFGLPVVEAMACGTPVITSRTSSLGEVAGDAARLVDPESEADIADALHALAGDAALRRELSRRGIARAAAFSWERTGRETLAVYEEIAEEAHRR
jgi:glycosyltransferase involved in cell wall biosynthesis